MLKSTDLRFMLFERATLGDKPLFAKPRDAAQAMAAVGDAETNPYFEKPHSIEEAFSALKRPNGKLPEKMIPILELAVRKVAKGGDPDRIWRELKPYVLSKGVSTAGLSPEKRIQFDQMLASAANAKEHVIVRPYTKTGTQSRQHPLRETMMIQLGLISELPAGNRTIYRFVVGSPEQAREGWVLLFRQLVGMTESEGNAIPPQIAADRIANASKSGQLSVCSVAPECVTLPISVHDPTFDSAKGFIVFPFDTSHSIVEPIHPDFLREWKASFYNKLTNRELLDQKQSVWEDANPLALIQEAEQFWTHHYPDHKKSFNKRK